MSIELCIAKSSPVLLDGLGLVDCGVILPRKDGFGVAVALKNPDYTMEDGVLQFYWRRESWFRAPLTSGNFMISGRICDQREAAFCDGILDELTK